MFTKYDVPEYIDVCYEKYDHEVALSGLTKQLSDWKVTFPRRELFLCIWLYGKQKTLKNVCRYKI